MPNEAATIITNSAASEPALGEHRDPVGDREDHISVASRMP
ncbi:hypothetical protein [Nocardia coubleae]|nr:hypothetical protein [Nocardia coubleae]